MGYNKNPYFSPKILVFPWIIDILSLRSCYSDSSLVFVSEIRELSVWIQIYLPHTFSFIIFIRNSLIYKKVRYDHHLFFMDHIFGDTDDIAFGTSSRNHTQQKNPNTKSFPKQSSRKEDTKRNQERRPVAPPSRTHRTMESAQPVVSDIDSLTRLVTSMKPSFLPKEEDMNAVRLVTFSDSNQKDPLMLVTRDNETILVGSGFGEIVRAGKAYSTFPDMRLLYSEKEHISAWVLPENDIDITPIMTILPGLGFPPMYASREMITRLRESIHDMAFLDKCRFFELFPSGSFDRRIGAFEFLLGSNGVSSCIVIRSAWTQFGREISTISSVPWTHIAKESCFRRKDAGYVFGDMLVMAGEILSLKWGQLAKHQLKFTFDTFYIDGSSVWVVAWYTLPDREQLAENWILTFTLEEDSRVRTIAGHIFIDSRGFVHAYEMMSVHKEILKGIRVTYENLIVENPKIERGELVQTLRREITKYCYVLTGRTPVVMPIVIER